MPPRPSWVDLEKGLNGLGLGSAATLKLGICQLLPSQVLPGGSLWGQGKYLKVPELACGLTTGGFKGQNSQFLKTKTNMRL